MKNTKIYLLAALCSFGMSGCSDFLNVTPKAVLSENLVSGPENIDKYVVAAYSYIPSLWFFDSLSPWMSGCLRSDDSYKGGGGLGDQTPWYEMEIFTGVTSNVGNNDGVWYCGYQGISRVNTAIRQINAVTSEEFPQKEQRLAEMKFLRGWIYMKMKLRWKFIPYIDENVPTSAEDYEKVPNREDSPTADLDLWKKILNNFVEAAAVLPEQQAEKGRPTKYAAEAFAARTLLQMAYEQNDKHQVVNINKERLNEALKYIDDIMTKDKAYFDLCMDFGDNFLPEYDNNTKESLYEIQYSINDGTTDGRVNWGDQLNAPWWPPYFNCCDFHKVSYNLANAFRTDKEGLPLFGTFNEAELKNNREKYFDTNTFDARFGHTAAIPGLPFKYDATLPFDSAGARQPVDYGYMNSMKEQVHPDCKCLFKPFYVQNSMNKKEVRYAEVLLWKAEILIQLDRHMEALPLINRVRERAAMSTERLKWLDGAPTMNYKLGLYENGKNCNWTKEYALNALKWEMRLETACEGRRFYDLLRWGDLEKVMNDYFKKERDRFDWLKNGYFTAGRDEYLPIPQAQMNWSKGTYTQNPGY